MAKDAIGTGGNNTDLLSGGCPYIVQTSDPIPDL